MVILWTFLAVVVSCSAEDKDIVPFETSPHTGNHASERPDTLRFYFIFRLINVGFGLLPFETLRTKKIMGGYIIAIWQYNEAW